MDRFSTSSATTATTASSTNARSDAANPRAIGKYADLLRSHSIDQVDDDRVKAFVATGDYGDSKAATHIAQWCLDHGEPRLCDKVLASRGPDDQPLVTQLHMNLAAMDCVSGMPDCAHLASAQFAVRLEPAANVGDGLMDKLRATTQLNPAVRKLRFVSSGDAVADTDQLLACKEVFEKAPHLALDVSGIKLDLVLAERLIGWLLENASLESLSCDVSGVEGRAALLGKLVAGSKMTSLRVAGYRPRNDDQLVSSLSRSSLNHLDLGGCNTGGTGHPLKTFCELLANDKLPVRELVFPSLGLSKEVGLMDDDPVVDSHFLSSNRTLKTLDVSAVGYAASVWVAELRVNSTLESVCLPNYTDVAESFDMTLMKLSDNDVLTDIRFKAHRGAMPIGFRRLTEDEQSRLQAVGQRNRLRNEVSVYLGDAAGPAFALSAVGILGVVMPGYEDFGPIIGRHLAAGPNGRRDVTSLSLVNKAAQIMRPRAILSCLAEAKDHAQTVQLIVDLSSRGLRLSSKEADDVVKHPNLPAVLDRAAESSRFEELLSSLSTIGIPLQKLRTALAGMTQYETVLRELDRSRLGASKSHRTSFSALTLPSELPAAVRLLVDHGVVLRGGTQFREIERWCYANDQVDLLLAAIKLGQPKRLEIDCSMPDVAQLLKELAKFVCVTDLALVGSLVGDARVEAYVRLIELIRSSNKVLTLETRVECTAGTFRTLMKVVGSSVSLSSLSVSLPAEVGLDHWCWEIKQALRHNAKLSATLDLPKELQAEEPVKALLALPGRRVTFKADIAPQ
jgi:hypothetical protein